MSGNEAAELFMGTTLQQRLVVAQGMLFYRYVWEGGHDRHEAVFAIKETR